MAKGEMQGFVDCAECGADSPVRLNKNQKLFYVCPACGLIYPNMVEGQAKIRARLRPINAPAEKPPEEKKGDAEVAAGVGIVAPAPSSEVKPPVEPLKKPKPSILDMLP